MSRTLDREVAEKVFGNNVFTIGSDWSDRRNIQEGHNDRGSRILARYSTDIRAAFEVVEEMRRRGFVLCLAQNEHDIWEAEFEGNNMFKWSDAETAPLAICKAALEAVKEEKKG